MKKTYLFLLTLFSFIKINAQQIQQNEAVTVPFEQQMDNVFQHVNLSNVTSHHLLDRAYRLVDIEAYNGSLATGNIINYDKWCMAYGTLFTAAWQSQYRLATPANSYKPLLNGLTQTDVVPILLLHYNYHKIKSNALADNLLYTSGNQIYDVAGATQSAFQQQTCFAAAPYINKFTIGTIQFKIQNNLFFNNTGKTVSSVQVNFNDGNGFINVTMNNPVTVTYTAAGDYEVITKINYTDGSNVQSHSSINIDITSQQQYSFGPNESFHITASKSYQGQNGGALVSIYYACGNNAVTKPLIIVEGFDPPQQPYFQQFHAYNMIDKLNNYINTPSGIVNLYNDFDNGGYDLIYVDFDNGADYIQKNAFVVEEVLNQVNLRKHNNNSTEKNVIAGFSMGGLVTRYALRDMEANNPVSLQHECSKYISFDTPHEGANIPLGFQYLLSHLNNVSIYGYGVSGFTNQIQTSLDILNTPAAQQMLIYHYNGISSYPVKTAFFNDLNNLGNNGWPVNCQNVAVSNGSELGYTQKQPFNAGDMIFSASWSGNTYDILELAYNNGVQGNGLGGALLLFFGTILQPSIDIDIRVHALPNTSSNYSEIYYGKFEADVFFGLITTYLSELTVEIKNNLPLDNAPGGTAEINGYYNGQIGGFPGSINLYIQTFCFIPTISSLALPSPQNQDVYYDVHNNPSVVNKFNLYTSPGVYPVNVANEEHVALTYNNVLFLEDNVIDLAQPLLSSVQNINGQDFNYGANATQHTDNRITNDVTIGNGGKICVNCDIPLGFTGSGLNNPTQLSTFNVYTASCTGSTNVVINNNGILECGNTSPGNKGNLYFKSGSSLTINNGGKLIIHDNSQLIIEPGASITINAGAIIELRGQNALLDVQGTLNNITLNAAEQISFNKATASIGGTAKFASGTLTMNPGSTLASDGCRVLFNGTQLSYTHDATFYLNEPEAYIYFDPQCDITLNNNESLLLTKGNSSIGGILHLNTGTFNLNSGNITSDNCKLMLNDYNFNYYQNSNINLYGDEAELRFGGYIYLQPNSDLHFNGSGYFGFKLAQNWGTWKNIIADPTASITITGIDPSDKIIVIENNTWFNVNDELSKLTIHNGQVLFGDNSTLNVAAPFEFTDLDATTAFALPWGGGFVVGGQSNHKIQHVNFHNLNYGLRGYLFWANGASLTIRDCNFYDCTNSLIVYDKGIHLYNTTFTNCGDAILGNGMSFPSTMYTVDVNGPMFSGVNFTTTGGGSLFMNRCRLFSDQGVIYSGNSMVTIKCSEIHTPLMENIIINQNGSLNLSTNIPGIKGGYNDLHSLLGINFDNANQAYLDKGYNDFSVDAGLAMSGTLYNNCLTTLIANKNKWHVNDFNPPVLLNDYDLHCTNCNPPGRRIYLFDNAPDIAVCNTPHDVNFSPTSPLADRQEYPPINSEHFEGIPLNIAVKMALDTMEIDTSGGDDLVAIAMLSEILEFSYRYDQDYINWLTSIAYIKIKEALSHAIQDERIENLSEGEENINKVIQIINLQIEKSRETDDDNNEFYAHIDLASVYRSINNRSQALQILQGLPSCLRLNDSQFNYLNKLTTQFNAEEMVLNGTIKIEEFEEYAGEYFNNRTFIHYLNTQANIDSVFSDSISYSVPTPLNIVQDNAGNNYTISTVVDSTMNYKIAKTNDLSEVIWEQEFDGKQSAVDSIVGITIDRNNFIYVTGKSWNGLDFDIVTVKYDTAGNQYWTAVYNDLNIGNDEPLSISVDTSFHITVYAVSHNDSVQLFKSIFYSQCDSNCVSVSRGVDHPLNGTAKHFDLSLYPNPATDRVNIEIRSDLPSDIFQVKVYDIEGKEVYSGVISHKYSLSTSLLAKGIFEVVITNEKGNRLKQRLVIR